MSESVRCTEDDIKSWLKIILKREGIHNFHTEILGTSEKGDGYLGDITFVKVHGKTVDLDLVVKCGKNDRDLRQTTPVRLAFENEIIVYDEILPLFAEFQNEHGVKEPFENVPKCYGTLIFDDMEVIVLENLKNRDFVVLDRTHPMDIEHIRTIIALYAKLHAISFALRDQKPQVFREISKKLGDVCAQFATMFPITDDYHPYQDVVDYATEKNELEAAEKARNLEKELLTITNFMHLDDPYSVILHGDCWNNNFMVKLKDGNEISDVCFLDWQLSRVASPVHDLSYFLFTNLAPQDADQFDQINDWYYDNLCQFMQELGSDPNKVYPHQQFQDHWKKYFKFGMYMMPGIVRICLSDKDEVPDLADLKSENDVTDIFFYKVKKFDEFGRRCLAILQLVINKGFL